MSRQMLVVGALSLIFSSQIFAQCIKGNCQNGYGKFQYRSGAVYQGNFKNGQIHGQGALFFSNGDKYIGQWENRYREGKGKLTYHNGDVYQGNFVRNEFNGHGVIEFANGDEYDGNFVDGQFQGKGTMVYANGNQYIGEWKNNQRHGVGKLILTSGNVQEGDWEKDKYQEEYPLADNNIAVNDKNLRDCNQTYCENGKGVYNYPDGAKYVGDFENGKPAGYGTCIYSNGDKYVGYWQNHGPNGEGVYTYINSGKTIAAIWQDGEAIRPLETLTAGIGGNVEVEATPEVKIWSVVVGVSTYEHMPALRFTDDDAYRFYAFLKSPEGGALPNDQIKLLIDEDATRNNILAALKETLLKADENDVIVFYYSGHGLEGSFIPVDYDGFNNRVLHDEIKQVFEQSRAKHKIIFADACYSGSLLAMKGLVNSTLEKYYASFRNAKGGLAFFTSSQGGEISLEDGGLRQGIFTHFLIKGLNGEADTDQNKVVTIAEIAAFVSKKVRSYTAKVQTPVLTGNYDTNMPVAVIR